MAVWVRSYFAFHDVSPRPIGEEGPAPTSSAPKPESAPEAPRPQTEAPASTAVPGGAVVQDLPGDWPGFRGPNRDGIEPGGAPIATNWNQGGIRLLWSIPVGEGYAAAAVHKGRVYLLDYDEAKQADALRCLSLADGKEVWRRSYPNPLKRNHGLSRTVPAVTDKVVVAIGPKCTVLCCDPATGAEKWRIDMVRQWGATVPDWYAGQCPLIDGGKLLLAPGGKALMVALNPETGKPIWQCPNPRRWRMTHSSIVPMDLDGQRMYVYCGSGGVAGVSAKDGKLLWDTTEWTVNTATVPSPLPVGNGRILLTGGYNAGSLMLQVSSQGGRFSATPVFRLSARVFSSDQQTPILYQGYVYGVRPNGEMTCLDLNGKSVWTSGRANRFGLGPYAIVGGMLLAMNDSGLLTLAKASPEGYRPLATAQVLRGRESWGPLAIAGTRVIARDSNRMVCVDIGKR